MRRLRWGCCCGTEDSTVRADLAIRLSLELSVQEATSPREAWQNVAAPVDAGQPVGLPLDSYYLDYFGSKVHFGGHAVAM